MLVSELKTKLRAWLGNRSVTAIEDEILGDLIDITIRNVFLACDSRYGELRLSAILTAGSSLLSLNVTDSNLGGLVGVGPTVSKILDITYVDGTTLRRLIQLSFDEFLATYPDFNGGTLPTGTPKHWTSWSSVSSAPACAVNILPVSESTLTYSAELYYLPGHFEDSDEPAILEEQPELILFGALSSASKYLIEDARGPMWTDAYERRLIAFGIQEASRNLSGRPLAARIQG